MLDILKTALNVLENNFHNIFMYTVIMVSSIIVTIGLLKPILFDKIKNKQVRKVALAFSNVALCFICALVIFLVKDWNFKYYLFSAIALTISSIVTYWFYENTCLRNLIATIGKIALRKLGNVALIALSKDEIDEIKTEAKKVSVEIKALTEAEIKKATTQTTKDKDLAGL